MVNEMGRSCNTCGEKRNAYGALEGKLERKRTLGRTRRRWGVVLRWELKSPCGKAWSIFGFTWGHVCSCKHSNETLGFIKCGRLLDYLRKN
jgi:hypothetical protein